MKKLIAVIGVLTSLGAVMYLDSTTVSLTDELRSVIHYPEDSETETVDGQTEDKIIGSQTPTLEWIFEKQEKVDGYILETYREYEIYSDENGNKIKQVPTSNFDYLQYKK
ncbi:hypothetical protein ACFSO7_13000 [Bacillus sp. CGMCC 1.16607]|uniref:hypothetical protein n=1 Tax=Bacillus sp. CGMCC 1.16607 TaxID=3351842 RepID=UPI003637D56F